jgi:amyloid beta precursor protein binding protein 1
MTKDLDSMENHEHGHIPYVVILLHYLEQWKATRGDYPKNYAEKTEFRKMVADSARRDNPEGGEENFDEAVAAVVKTIVPSSLPSSLKEVFAYIHTQPVCFIEVTDTVNSQ